jgi:hypothetical protein
MFYDVDLLSIILKLKRERERERERERRIKKVEYNIK